MSHISAGVHEAFAPFGHALKNKHELRTISGPRDSLKDGRVVVFLQSLRQRAGSSDREHIRSSRAIRTRQIRTGIYTRGKPRPGADPRTRRSSGYRRN